MKIQKSKLSPNQLRVYNKLRQAKQEGVKLFLTGADKRTAISLVKKGLVKNIVRHGVMNSVQFEVI